MKYLALIAVLYTLPALASDGDAESWFDQAEAEAARLRQINTGSLDFHASPPATRIHQLYNRLDIHPASLAGGYVDLRQCHAQLDPIHRAEIRYRYQRMQGLRLESWQGMERAWVEGDSVQMINVEEGAQLCIRARVAILRPREGGGYTLRSGPFHRRFLDGYFPMRVILDIHYPPDLLDFDYLEPRPQPGFTLSQADGALRLEALFSGRLTLELGFRVP